MKAYFKVWLTVLALALGPLVMITLASQPTRAAGPWFVAPGGDDGNDCLSPATTCATIHGAIAKASSGDTIYVATGTYTGTGDEVVLLDKDVTLSGGWDGTFTTQSGNSTIDGEESRRGITVNGGVIAIVERFTLQNGDTNGDGGGIVNQGTVTMINSTVSGNLVQLGGEGGGIFNAGTLTMTNSTVSDNSTGLHFGRGGGIFNQGTLTMINSAIQGNDVFEANGGGGIFNAGRLTIISSTISDNRNTGFFGSGGGVSNAGTLTITNSTVSDNAAASPGGGISNGSGGVLSITNSTISRNAAHYGGAGLSNSGVLTITNTTISSNTTSYYIGMCCGEPIGGSGILNQGKLTLNSTTIAGNSANHVDLDGGGIQNRGQVEFGNTIIAGNITVADDPDCSNSESMISLGYNLVGENTGCPTVATDQVVNPADIFATVLGPLRNNGGDTETHALLPNSPAIDAGDDSACPATDQRGVARPQGSHCDIGAYEFEPPTIVVPIDIKPGSDPNSINCNNENGVITVAILTTEDFNATTLDHTTVTFEGASEMHVDKKSGQARRHEEDVDGDGDTDLVFHFRLGDTDLTCGSTEGTLTGETYDGRVIEGTDTVRMIDQGGGKP